MRDIILASGSPRRKELLTLAGVEFTVKTADTDEDVSPFLSPGEVVAELSKRKCLAVAKLYPDSTVIGADTVVAADEKILGKPKDENEAYEMLSMLSGRSHHVYTGVFIKSGENEISFCEKTEVTFFELTDDEIRAYIATGDCLDKAGAYGVQSKGCTLVEKINGDYYNVVGLPLAKTVRALKNL